MTSVRESDHLPVVADLTAAAARTTAARPVPAVGPGFEDLAVGLSAGS
jgi:hypothetical protein